MATTRKDGAAKAPTKPRAARPRTTSAAPAAPERIDILDDLGINAGPPQPISLLGVECDVRRRFTGAEVVHFFKLAGNLELGAMLTLITSDGPALWAKIEEIDPDNAAKALNRIINISGLHEGKLLAPLPLSAFTSPTAGAQPSPESSTTTA